ncbi:MAG: class I SAM-dependent methyltransferase [Clostridiales bacterium]|nr:class I SAM-dependent methyltransferase [Clostridiales bacterium]
MADHYYTAVPTSEHRPGLTTYEYRGHKLNFETDSGVFSRTEIDEGTDLLLRTLPEVMAGDVLDLGCGYGVIGISVAKHWKDTNVLMADVNERACGLSVQNAKKNGVAAKVIASDGYANIPEGTFDYILQNPPIRAGKAVIYEMFAQGAARLNEGGSLWLVIRKQQGAPSAQTYLKTLFHQVTIPRKKSGFWIFCCTNPQKNTEVNEQ